MNIIVKCNRLFRLREVDLEVPFRFGRYYTSRIFFRFRTRGRLQRLRCCYISFLDIETSKGLSSGPCGTAATLYWSRPLPSTA
ncbi:hypothetical protein ACPOL_1653 [Acidisarcina polymorpha]|uniref:Uncharacterized protein n=1 Tax=Acidisarcina polymorpha TaxID=2211140 RepID=A0A2Z5FVT3_9BACT|nr:hypothetical protein ACPOL_1653 [Acidisarcina polymorpha]